MYNERKDSFSIRDFIIQLLFIVLFVFIMIWLFPTKGDIKGNNKISGLDEVNSKFDALTNHIFNDNLQTMKDAAINYYTTSRLPKNVNDVKSMTLREMLKEKLLIEFKDANNKSCKLDDSYVQVTKLEDEFLMKINLSCSDNDAYILVHLGCYDYCKTDVCEKKNTEAKPVVVPTPTPTPTPKPTCTYKYQKNELNYYWSNWSNWSTTAVTATSYRQIDTKFETTTKDVNKAKITTTTTPVTTMVQKEVTKVSSTYCASLTSQYTSTGEKKYEWIDQGTSYYTTPPAPDANTKYVLEGSNTIDCSDCYNGVLYIYRKYTLKVYDVVTNGTSVCSSWKTIEKPVYISVPEIIKYNTEKKVTPVIVKENVKTTYYKYRTLESYTNTLTKWSSSKNDVSLINQGYKYTTSVCK